MSSASSVSLYGQVNEAMTIVSDILTEPLTSRTEQSRRCPLCAQTIGAYLMHHIRSRYDYQKHHLTPLRSSPPPLQPLQSRPRQAAARRLVREREWGRRQRQEREEADELDRAIDRRRWIYQHGLFAKVSCKRPLRPCYMLNLLTACCIKYAYALSTFSYAFSVCCIAGYNKPSDSFYSSGIASLDQSRRRGAQSCQSSQLAADVTLTSAVLDDIHHLSHALNRHPLGICSQTSSRISRHGHMLRGGKAVHQFRAFCAR